MRWTDKAAVASRVASEIASLLNEARYSEERTECDAVGRPLGPLGTRGRPDLLAAIILMKEEDAIALEHEPEPYDEAGAYEAARRGNLKPLIAMLRPDVGIPNGELFPNQMIPSIRPRTWTLICEFLAGDRNLTTAKSRGVRGRAKLSERDRQRFNPVRAAEAMVPLIRAVLVRLFPGQPRLEINKRADQIAEGQAGVVKGSLALWRKTKWRPKVRKPWRPKKKNNRR
jgi:hypothetical protein